MWPLMLFVTALGAHAVLIAWAKITFRLGTFATAVLAAVGVSLSLALFLPRENFGVTSLELVWVALGASMFVAFGSGMFLVQRLRRKRPVRAPAPHANEPSEPSDASAPVDAAMKGAPTPATPSRRQLLVGVAGAASWSTSAAMLAWGNKVGRHDFELVETPIVIPGLPRALDGYVIVQISDLHLGASVGERDLDAGLALAALAKPDLVVVTGDFVDFDPSYAGLAASRITGLAPRDGVYGILGNHDYYADADAVRQALSRGGIQMLVDEARAIRSGDSGGFTLLGLDELSAPRYGGRGPDLPSTLAKADALGRDKPRILLAHQPRLFDEVAGNVALQLSGHTHGLQFDVAARLGRMAHRYVSGRYEKLGSTLWVNRGFGVTGPASRVGVRPEITKIVLVAG